MKDDGTDGPCALPVCNQRLIHQKEMREVAERRYATLCHKLGLYGPDYQMFEQAQRLAEGATLRERAMREQIENLKFDVESLLAKNRDLVSLTTAGLAREVRSLGRGDRLRRAAAEVLTRAEELPVHRNDLVLEELSAALDAREPENVS